MGGGLSALGSALVLDDGAAAAAQEDHYADVAEGEQRARDPLVLAPVGGVEGKIEIGAARGRLHRRGGEEGGVVHLGEGEGEGEGERGRARARVRVAV